MEQNTPEVAGTTKYLDEHDRLYTIKEDGFVSFGDVSRTLLGQQCQYGSRFIDGSVRGYPNLGLGLSFSNLDDFNYHEIGIHPDDIAEFGRRFWAWNAYTSGWVVDPNNELHELNFQDLKVLEKYLVEDVGLDLPS